MVNAFSQLPEDTCLDTICGHAGKVFAARKANNPQTNFNTEIWYLAGDAMSAGFSALRGMKKEWIARAMGDSISRHINAQHSYGSGVSQLPEKGNAISGFTSISKDGIVEVSKGAGTTLGTLAGSYIGGHYGAGHGAVHGAAIGTAVAPGPGTAIGTLVGAAIGTYIGYVTGRLITER